MTTWPNVAENNDSWWEAKRQLGFQPESILTTEQVSQVAHRADQIRRERQAMTLMVQDWT